MSFFVLGLKSDVFFFNINYTQFLLNKTKSILKNFLKKKKNVIFVIPTTVLQISKIRKTIKTRKYLHQNISTLEIITIAN
jgi:endonuclease IV